MILYWVGVKLWDGLNAHYANCKINIVLIYDAIDSDEHI